MKIRVLGSAAGGGFPQWNCGCSNCRCAREGSPHTRCRTQECVAISSDGDDWFLLNASPEIRQQLESYPPLHPRAARHSPIAGILLTNGDLDHTLGLLSLRESHPLTVYATEPTRRGFCEDNVLYRTLERFPGQVTWRRLGTGQPAPLLAASGRESALTVRAVPVPGKLPIHLERTAAPDPEQAVGLVIHDRVSGGTLAYFSSFGAWTPAIERELSEASCAFVDGTFWSSTELGDAGLGTKRAEDMAHAPLGGADGTLSKLSSLPGRRVLIHINNSNPVLMDDSAEAHAVRAAGVEVAYDGMELSL